MEHSHHGSSGNYECIIRRFDTGKDLFEIILQTNKKHENVKDISNEIYNIVRK